ALLGSFATSFVNDLISQTAICCLKSGRQFIKLSCFGRALFSDTFFSRSFKSSKGFNSIEFFSLFTLFYNLQTFNQITLHNGINHILTFYNIPKNSMLIIQPRRGNMGNEKLTSIRSRSRIGHRQYARRIMTQIVMELIIKLVAWISSPCSL